MVSDIDLNQAIMQPIDSVTREFDSLGLQSLMDVQNMATESEIVPEEVKGFEVKSWNPFAGVASFAEAIRFFWAKRVWYGDLKNGSVDIDPGLSDSEKCQKYGYTLIKHEVVTEDGYILELH